MFWSLNHWVKKDSRDRPESETRGNVRVQFDGEFSWIRARRPWNCGKRILDTVSAGKNLHFGHFGKLHFGKLHFGNNVTQTNIAVAIAVAIGGSVVQLIDQSNVSSITM